MTKCILSLVLSCSILTACQSSKDLLPELTQKDEPYRPAYHHSPEQNWMNDPNGMFYDSTAGLWHLYFQYNPQATVWGNMTWAHAVSSDLIHWKQKPNAIMPDDLGMIFSGSIVIDTDNTAGFGANAIVAMYTAAADAQRQAIAYSNDGGYTFTKYEGNPVLTADIPDFRDPKVFWNNVDQQWNMVLAAGQEVRFYASSNLKDWTYLSSFGAGYGCHGGVWECPDLIRFDNKDVLIVNINPGGIHGGSATQYFVGNWDGEQFIIDPTQGSNTYWMDYGKDHYATVSFHNAPNNRKVVLAWMSNWQYAGVVPTEHFRSQNSIARDVELVQQGDNGYRLYVHPSPEYARLDIPTYDLSYTGRSLTQELNGGDMLACLHLNVQLGTEPVSILLSNTKDEYVELVCDPVNHTLSMNRTHSGLTDFHPDFAAVTSAPLPEGNEVDMVVYMDRCSMEIFLNKGYAAMTNLVFPTEPYNHLTIK